MIALCAAAVLLSGLGTTAFAFRGARRPLRIAAGALAGAGLWSMSYAAVLFAAGTGDRAMAAKDVLLAAAGLLALALARRVPRALETSARSAPHRAAALVAAGATICTGLFLEHTIRFPDGGEDASTIWNLRARFLYRAGDAFRDAFAPDLVFWAHQDYPLLWPGLVAQCFRALSTESFWVPAALAWSVAALAAALLSAFIAELREPRWGLLATAVLLSTPAYVTFAADQYADVPMAAFLLLASGSVALAIERDRPARLFAFAGLALSMCAWTKNEGLLYAGCFVAALLLQVRPVRERLRDAGLVLAGAVPGLALLAAFKVGFAHESDLVRATSLADALARVAEPERWADLSVGVLRRLVYVQNWALHLVAAVAAALYVARVRSAPPASRVLAFAAMLAVGAFAGLYLVQPYPLPWFLRVTIDRLLLQLWPTALLALFLAVAPRPEPGHSAAGLEAASSPSSGVRVDSSGASPKPQASANERYTPV